MKKTFQELTIKDPFMFAAVMSEEHRCKKLLEVILDKEILNVTVETEKTLNYHYDYRSVRLDVLAVEAGTEHHYNVEMQVKDLHNLAKRSRYYHSHMNMDMLLKGKDYNLLPDTYVIFICDYDPVGKELYRYSFCKRCIETGDMLEDGSHTIWLSTEGKNAKDIPEVLVSFLNYVRDPEHTETEGQEFVDDVNRQVASIKHDRRWEETYMQFQEMLADERAEGKVEQLQDNIQLILGVKGEVPDVVKTEIMEQHDTDVLKSWLLKAAAVKEINEFTEMIKQK